MARGAGSSPNAGGGSSARRGRLPVRGPASQSGGAESRVRRIPLVDPPLGTRPRRLAFHLALSPRVASLVGPRSRSGPGRWRRAMAPGRSIAACGPARRPANTGGAALMSTLAATAVALRCTPAPGRAATAAADLRRPRRTCSRTGAARRRRCGPVLRLAASGSEGSGPRRGGRAVAAIGRDDFTEGPDAYPNIRLTMNTAAKMPAVSASRHAGTVWRVRRMPTAP